MNYTDKDVIKGLSSIKEICSKNTETCCTCSFYKGKGCPFDSTPRLWNIDGEEC